VSREGLECVVTTGAYFSRRNDDFFVWNRTGKRRGIEGGHVVHQNLLLEHLVSSHQWRYSLHPGLWSLKALYNLLVELDTILSELTERSPWAFERVGGTDAALGKSEEAASCYRIYSSGIVQPYKNYMVAGVLRTLGKLSRGFAGRVGGHKWWHKSSRRFDFLQRSWDAPNKKTFSIPFLVGLMSFQNDARYGGLL
jgi:hypothetical protein